MPKFRYGEIEADDQVGLVTGLAWTEVGGELLTIEGVMMPGKGRMTVTGNLKDVMKESISAAASYVRSRAVDFGIEPPLFDKRDIHVHVPEGATPKDGPSAGVAMATVIVSMLTGIPVRRDIAMTGEITLRGRVLPIGGLKEKLLAALRGGIKKVLIPEENAKDLADIPNSVKNGLEIVPVSRMEEVLAHALIRQPEPIVWEEDARRRPRRPSLWTMRTVGHHRALSLPGRTSSVAKRLQIPRDLRPFFCSERKSAARCIFFCARSPANPCVSRPNVSNEANSAADSRGKTALRRCRGEGRLERATASNAAR